MTWVKVDSGFPNHPKFVGIGDDGLALWVRALAHCNQYLTDGYISDDVLPSLTRSKKPAMVARKLTEVPAGFEVGLWVRESSGYRFHDYHEYQPSKGEVLDKVSKRKESGKIGGEKSGDARRASRQKGEAKTDEVLQAKVERPLNPGPIRSDPDQIPLTPAFAGDSACASESGSDPEAGKLPKRRIHGNTDRQVRQREDEARQAAAKVAYAAAAHTDLPPSRSPPPIALPARSPPPDVAALFADILPAPPSEPATPKAPRQ